jgi:hypothetical protein
MEATMGYYSNFEVIDTDIEDIVSVLNDLEYGGWHQWNANVCLSETKWYNWISDLGKLAMKYPDNFLIIERAGEESPDISRAYMRNGKVVEVEPEIIWPEVN